MQLILIGLWDSSERVKVREELYTVMRLNVMHAVAEHLQQRVQDPPRVRLEHIGQELT